MSVRLRENRLPTLQERYDPRRNAFGLLRLSMALAVLTVHVGPVGFGGPNLGAELFKFQTDPGTMSLYGFFLISGFLITESALRTDLRSFLRARFLRVFPGLWACLLVTAFVLAPLVALRENGTLADFWTHPEGPFDYVATNFLASMEQFPISGLLAGTPFGHIMGGPSAFDGSLWTLRYDLAFYALVAILLATSVLRQAPRAVLVVTLACYALILHSVVTAGTWTSRVAVHGAIGPFPFIGAFAADWTLQLGFLFLLGVSARLYAHRVPIHRPLAVTAAVVTAVTLWQGAFLAVGLPAYAYVVLYAAVSLRGRLTGIGRRHDYTYGIYIYGFPVQQVLAVYGGNRYGTVVYLGLSVLGTLLLAVPSWHLVERPALRLKARRAKHRSPQRATIESVLSRPVAAAAVPRPSLPGRRRTAARRAVPARSGTAARTVAARMANSRGGTAWSYRDTVRFLEETRQSGPRIPVAASAVRGRPPGVPARSGRSAR